MKKIITKYGLVLSLISLIVIPGTTLGGNYYHGYHGKFLKKMDANNDRRVTQAEFNRHHQKKFARLDDNGDGFISLVDEVNKAYYQKKLAKVDANADKMVSKAEFDNYQNGRFSQIDSNQNLVIDAKEIIAYSKQKRFDRFDKDQDGTISQTEYLDYKGYHKGDSVERCQYD